MSTEEPPAKRARRTDAAAMWETNETKSPRSPRPSGRDPERRSRAYDAESRNGTHGSRREEERRHRSRSRERHERRRERSRSKERSHKGHERERDRGGRDRDRDRDRDGYSRRDRDRSRSRERPKSSRDYPPTRSERPQRRSRSRSPVRNGASTSTRTRSPPRSSRTDHERPPQRDKGMSDEIPTGKGAKPDKQSMQDTKPQANGDTAMAEESDEDALIRNMMGFSGFKSTKNTKVPGNQIYGVRKEKKTEYRQYMNRVGGFNRPLSPSR